MFSRYAITEISSGLRLYRFWIYSAFIKFQIAHNRTLFSFFWEPITVLIVASTLTVIWSKILGIEDAIDYFFYVMIGFALWSLLISKLINRAVASFGTRANELTQIVRPIPTLPLEEIAYSFINFFSALPFILVAAFSYYGFSPQLTLMFLFGLFLIWITSIGLCLTLGILAFFVQDVMQIIKAIMRLGFLVTPIIWKPDRLGEYANYVWLNPFYSYIDICRSALQGQWPHFNSIMIASSVSLVLLMASLITLNLFGRKIRTRVFA